VASIDLNADLGEGFGVWRLGDDDAMLGIVTSANIACGFHAGDPAGLLSVCRLAAERGVRIGAQVSYRDLAGFGRRFIDVAPEDLHADRRSARTGSGGRHYRVLRQTPWRAVQHDRDQS
jgi:5-oxoprolinase (ATP-hydrolysing) subunit A